MIKADIIPAVIAIDGPAASGKSTIGQLLAKKLGHLFLDTGIMYRAVTLAAAKTGVDYSDEAAVVALAQSVPLVIAPVGEHTDGRLYTVLIGDEDVTWALRSAAVEKNVSLVSSYAGVRAEMVTRQRAMAAQGSIVMVGRDIGTVVVPDAPMKLFVVATAEERARRRWQEHHDSADYDAILADILRRDAFDSKRAHSPLRPACDSIHLDTTGFTPAELIEQIAAYF